MMLAALTLVVAQAAAPAASAPSEDAVVSNDAARSAAMPAGAKRWKKEMT